MPFKADSAQGADVRGIEGLFDGEALVHVLERVVVLGQGASGWESELDCRIMALFRARRLPQRGMSCDFPSACPDTACLRRV
eukprot:363813-Rhodomonas_salina.3